MKATELFEDFKREPIKPISKADNLTNICAISSKKCALLFTKGSNKDRTAYEYLKEIAVNFIN